MILGLDEEEKEVLTLVLKSFDAELRGEIGKTDNRKYKGALHGEEDVIKKLLEKISLQKA